MRVQQHTVEYTIGRFDGIYWTEVNGEHLAGPYSTLAAAQARCRDHALKHGHEDAGITEAFGRNRQWVRGPRGGWSVFTQRSAK